MPFIGLFSWHVLTFVNFFNLLHFAKKYHRNVVAKVMISEAYYDWWWLKRIITGNEIWAYVLDFSKTSPNRKNHWNMTSRSNMKSMLIFFLRRALWIMDRVVDRVRQSFWSGKNCGPTILRYNKIMKLHCTESELHWIFR